MIRQTLITMHERALRLFAHRWFLIGFSLTGAGFHGETFPVNDHKGARSLITAHFNRVWESDRVAKRDGTSATYRFPRGTQEQKTA
jgi:hypothetical protein